MPLPPDLSKPVFSVFPEMADRLMCGKCSFCAEDLTPFKDKISEKEFGVSGMCQTCQDNIFTADDDAQSIDWDIQPPSI